MGAIRVLLADGHTLVRECLCTRLSHAEGIEVVGEASSGRELLRIVNCTPRPHLVVTELYFVGISGIEVTRRIKKRFPEVQVIGLTAPLDMALVAKLVAVGGYSCMEKSRNVDDLVALIRQARFDPEPVDQELKRCLEAHQRTSTAWPSPGDDPLADVQLTLREIDVMRALMSGSDNKAIARQLMISERTVQTHLSNIFAKIRVSSRTEAVLVALHQGWIVQGP